MPTIQPSGAVRTIATGNFTDVKFSPDGATVYALGGSTVSSFNVATGAAGTSYTLPGTVFASDVSADGRYLLATATALSSVNGQQVASLYRLDLTTGAVATYSTPVDSLAGAFGDVAWLADGTALVVQGSSSSSRSSPVRLLDPASGSFTTLPQTLASSARLVASSDHREVLISGAGVGTFQSYVYTAGAGVTASHAESYDPYAGAAPQRVPTLQTALSGDGSRTYSFGQIRDAALVSAAAQPTGTPFVSLGGATLSPSGDRLYLSDGASSVVAFDTVSGTVLFAWDTGARNAISSYDSISGTQRTFSDVLQTSADGRYLLVTGLNGVTLIDLALVQPYAGSGNDTIVAGPPPASGANIVYGLDGNDTISGSEVTSGPGSTLIGGRGDDIYYVTAQYDQVIEGPGDGIDSVFTGTSFASFGGFYALPGNVENLTLTGTLAINGDGNALNNVITGNAAANQLSGGQGDDVLLGGDGNDILSGGPGADTIDGGAGDDTIQISAGDLDASDRLDGGSGFDLMSVLTYFSAVDISGLTLTGLEAISTTGTNAARLTREQMAQFSSVSGTFALTTGGALALGGVVVPATSGGAAALSLTLAAGGNSLDLTGLNVAAGVPYITVTGLSGPDSVIGSGGVDILSGGAGDDVLRGMAGNDTLIGGGGRDELYGGDGDDLFLLTSGDVIAGETYDGGTGQDIVRVSGFAADLSGVSLVGIEGVDGGSPGVAMTAAQLDGLTMVAGAVRLTTAGFVSLNGVTSAAPDNGPATSSFRLSDLGNTLDLSGYVTLATTITGGLGDDTVTGGSASDTLLGGAGSDVLNGAGGNDTLDGGTGDDRMAGGLGNDTYLVDSSGDLVFELAGEGVDTVRSTSASFVLPDNVERLTYVGAVGVATVLTGNAGDNILTGGSGNDYLDLGRGGADIAYGLAGDDAVFYGATFGQEDGFDGGAGNDQVGLQGDYSAGLAIGGDLLANVETIAVLPGFSYALSAKDSLLAAGRSITVYAAELGAADAFSFDGSAETNGSFRVFGGLGRDTITGGAQNDAFYFGPDRFTLGLDTVNGGAGLLDQIGLDGNYSGVLTAASIQNVETVALLPGTGSNTFSLAIDPGLVPVGKALTIYAVEVPTGVTVSGTDVQGVLTMFGGSGQDALSGGVGNDWLFGGNGRDTLLGSGGADTFYYDDVLQSTGVQRDTIDFDGGTADRIDLPFAVTGVAAAVSGQLSSGSFDADLARALGSAQLGDHQAVLFTASGGDLSGTFLVIDTGGGGYQGGQDYVMQLSASPASLSLAAFI